MGKLIVVLFSRAVESLAIFGNVGSFMTIPVGEIMGCSGLGVAIVASTRMSDHPVTVTGAALLKLRCMKVVRRADGVRAMEKNMGRIALAPDVWRLLQCENE